MDESNNACWDGEVATQQGVQDALTKQQQQQPAKGKTCSNNKVGFKGVRMYYFSTLMLLFRKVE